MFSSNVQPPKIIRPRPQAWRCQCMVYVPRTLADDYVFAGVPQRQPGYLSRCSVCRMARPKEA